MLRGSWPPARSSSTGKPADLRKESDLTKPTVADLCGVYITPDGGPGEGYEKAVVIAVMG